MQAERDGRCNLMDVAFGRKEIMRSMHCRDWGTIRNWKRRYGLPLRYLPNGRAFLMLDEAKIWMVEFDRLKKLERAKRISE